MSLLAALYPPLTLFEDEGKDGWPCHPPMPWTRAGQLSLTEDHPAGTQNAGPWVLSVVPFEATLSGGHVLHSSDKTYFLSLGVGIAEGGDGERTRQRAV